MSSGPYLRALALPSEGQETAFILSRKMTCHNSIYPFRLFPEKQLQRLSFAPVTVLYGSNGKKLLRILSEKFGLNVSEEMFSSALSAACIPETRRIPADYKVCICDDVSVFLQHRALPAHLPDKRVFSLYLFSEPENHLSAEQLQAFAAAVDAHARWESCQFLIATCSPVLRLLCGKIIDLDSDPLLHISPEH